VDIDTCGLAPLGQSRALGELAGRGSELHKKHRVYLEHVTVNTVPCDHEERAILIDTPGLENLTLLALEAHDLALSKLERSQDRDIADVQYLARQGHINAHQLQERYFEHQRPYMVGDLRRYDFCFNLWLNLCWPEEFPG
jgi:hypothetical protein